MWKVIDHAKMPGSVGVVQGHVESDRALEHPWLCCTNSNDDQRIQRGRNRREQGERDEDVQSMPVSAMRSVLMGSGELRPRVCGPSPSAWVTCRSENGVPCELDSFYAGFKVLRRIPIYKA